MNKARLKHVYDKYPSKTNWEKTEYKEIYVLNWKGNQLDVILMKDVVKGAIQMIFIKLCTLFRLTKAWDHHVIYNLLDKMKLYRSPKGCKCYEQ